MARKEINYKIKGMALDLGPAVHNPEFSFENKNVRITSRENNSLLTVENEKGTLKYTILNKDELPNSVQLQFKGSCVGSAVINDNIVIFTHELNNTINPDYIYLLSEFSTDEPVGLGEVLYNGNLGFSEDAPIETLVSYENELIQKVYWIDKINSPRVINIKADKTKFISSDYFNFVNKLNLNEEITIIKNEASDGLFPAGTVQYAFTYYNKFGQETNIFYTSPILYSTNKDRGGSPGEVVSNTFTIKLKNIDTSFEYLRIYSIVRTSIDATPILKIVADIDTTQDEVILETISPLVDNSYNGYVYIQQESTFTRDANPWNITVLEYVFRAEGTANIYGEYNYYKRTALGDIIPIYANEGYMVYEDASRAYFNTGDSIICQMWDYSKGLYVESNLITKEEKKGAEFIINSLVGPTDVYATATNDEVKLIVPEGTEVTIHKVTNESPIVQEETGNAYTISFINLIESLFYKKVGTSLIQLTTLSGLTLAPGEALIIKKNIDLTTTRPFVYNYTDHTHIALESGQLIITNSSLSTTINTTLTGSILTINSATVDTTLHIDNLVYASSVNYTDNNTTGETIDSTRLLYVGGEDIVVGAITLKDNTLFLGNISLKKEIISNRNYNSVALSYKEKELYKENSNDTYYGYVPEGINSKKYINGVLTNGLSTLKTFKYGETYRFGIQAQHKTGRWSDVLFIGDKENPLKPQTLFSNNSVIVKGSKVELIITDNINLPEEERFLLGLKNSGFVRIRGVVVYPSVNDRTVVAQGIVNPTLMNVADKANKTVDNMSSWFFRPIKTGIPETVPSQPTLLAFMHHEYRHNRSIPGWFKNNAEIQSNDGLPAEPYVSTTATDFISRYSSNFYVDQSILTFHSPEIEFDELIQGLEGELFKMRIIGLAPLTAYKPTLNIEAGSPSKESGGKILPNLGVRNYGAGSSGLSTYPAWKDRVVAAKSTPDTIVNFMVYPWHADRSLNNQPNVENRTAKLINKQLSHFRYSGYNSYFDNWVPANGISTLGIYNQINDNIVKINSTYESNSKLIYKGSVDKLIGANRQIVESGGYPITVNYNNNIVALFPGIRPGTAYTTGPNGELPDDYLKANELIRMTFKSTTHGIIGLNWAQDRLITLPALTNDSIQSSFSKTLFWKEGSMYYALDSLNLPTNTYKDGGFYIAELYRDNVSNRFGGNNKAAYENNTWLPCGEPVKIIDENGQALTSVTLEYTEGDTFIQRYDCLKTFSESLSQLNSIVDIASFIVETHINLDGRYDRNRGNIDNTTALPSTFNLMNSVYNQKNNYFTYHALDADRFSLNKFPNTFTWSKTKIAGELIDTWTNVTMASTYDTNGELGEIRSLTLFNNLLIGFQDRGLFNVLYNTRVQLSVSDGLPIELSNSGKVDGIRYFSTNIGTKNKFSVKVSPAGIYFVDDEAKTINVFNGQVNILSDSLGFRTWMNKYHRYSNIFNVNSLQNFVTHYDKVNKDVYFINDTYALCYSELLLTFTSFYDYNNIFTMFNVQDGLFSFNKDLSTMSTTPYLWKHRAGNYSQFYGVNKPFYVKYLVNPEFSFDKVFDTLDLRADVFTESGVLIPGLKPFDRIKVQTEYQNTEEVFNDTTLRNKFRVWRGLVPRATSSVSSIFPSNPNKLVGMDRIRNPWAYFTLLKDANTSNTRTLLHDVTFNYTI